MDNKELEKRLCRESVVFFILVILYALVMLLFSLPVHAAEKTWTLQSNSGIYNFKALYYGDLDSQSPTRRFEYTVYCSDDKSFYAFAPLNNESFPRLLKYTIGSGSDPVKVTDNGLYSHPYNNSLENGFVKQIYYDITVLPEKVVGYGSNGAGFSFSDYAYDSQGNKYPYDWIDKGNLFIFDSVESMKNYCLSGDMSGLVYGGGGSIDNPDFQDTAYAFIGFTANNKMTATWTGTTERTYLKDEEVEEYVRVSYGFADKDAPDSIKQVDNDSTEYSTAAKSLTVRVSDLVPDDDSWFLRYVQVIPCYRQAGLGAWGDFYHGVPCKVYFNEDGSIDKIVRDFPQSSGDYSYKHIFSSDKYSKSIPAPELSSISHNGFTLLNNTNNEYYVDIIVESKFYGVKMEKSAGTWLPTVDTDWTYSSHYYNFADTSQVAINNDVIYFPNLFSANPENDLITDFKKWSAEYPNYSDLPTMSFLKRSTAARTTYNLKFLFDEDSNYTDSEQLRYSSCAESVFYVRYYNKSMVYGPWVRYKYRDGASAKVGDTDYGGAFVDVGQVDTDDDGNVKVDESGNPVVSDNVSGRQDYDTGETNYGDSSFSFDLSDISKFFDYLKKIFESVLGSLSSFGSVVAACFPFLPKELVNALIFGICVMMFIGIIKVVKG